MEDKILQKIVSNVAENVNEMEAREAKLSNFKQILPALLEKGLDNVNLSMFDDSTRIDFFRDAGWHNRTRGR